MGTHTLNIFDGINKLLPEVSVLDGLLLSCKLYICLPLVDMVAYSIDEVCRV